MTRWVKWNVGPTRWHVVTEKGDIALTACDDWFVLDEVTFSDFEPVEDECRLCRRALDGGKAA